MLNNYPNVSEETKKKVAKAMQETLVNVLNAKPEHISVSIEDADPKDWPHLISKRVNKKDLFIDSEFVKDCVNKDNNI